MWTDTEAHRRIDAMLERLRRKGIMLHRPFPAARADGGRSRLGGLPEMPAGLLWPTGLDGMNRAVPLHFLAQIDCRALPRIEPPMPESGLLLFFARQDEECVWGATLPWSRDGQVIFVPDGTETQPRAVPQALPPIHDVKSRSFGGIDHHGLLPGEIGPNVHPAWPVIALTIDTWPDLSAFADTSLPADEYARRVAMLRAATTLAATGLPTGSGSVFGSDGPFRDGQGLQRMVRNQNTFPHAWILADKIARGLLYECQFILRSRGAAASLKDAAEAVVDAARAWVDVARLQPPHQAVDGGTAEKFRAWLMQVGEGSGFRLKLSQVLKKAAAASLAQTGGSAALAALFPAQMYRLFEDLHLPYRQEWSAGENGWRVDANIHQMLGWAPATQQADDSGDICLLQLVSDLGLGLMFGDVGEAAFWIHPTDLAARRFEKVRLSLQGH